MSESSVQSTVVGRPMRGNVGIVAALAAAVAAALSAWGTFGEGDPDVQGYLVVLGCIAVASGVVFGWVVPRALQKKGAGVTALVLSALAIVTIAAFWSGLPPVLAAGGIMLGLSGWNGRRGAGLCRAAVVLGVFAIAADIAVFIQDMAL